MYQLSAFMEIEDFILNGSSQNSSVGELSTQSKTYSKDIGIYSAPSLPKYTLNAFSSTLLETGAIEVPASFVTKLAQVTDWIYQTQIAQGSTQDKSVFLAALTQQFTSSLSGVDCGELVLARPGVYFPEWVNFTIKGLEPSHIAYANKLMVWYADESFQNQYIGGTLVVVPPLDNIDMFFSGRASIKAALDAITLQRTMQRMEVAKEGHPETSFSAEEYHWVNPGNTADKLATNWVVLFYGRSINDEDSVRQSIRDYISAHSSHTEAEWRAIFPDIYRTTEFTIYPRYKSWAIEDRVQQTGVYSPLVRMDKEVNYLKARLPAYSDAFIRANAVSFALQYRSIALVAVGTPENRGNLFALDDLFPDMINAPTNGAEVMWALQSPKTREFVLLLQNLVVQAEKATVYSELPAGMRKVTRLGVLYIVAKYDNITYLVATKATTPE